MSASAGAPTCDVNTFTAAIRSNVDAQAVPYALLNLTFVLTGHASSASPASLVRPAVFAHVIGATFWVGSDDSWRVDDVSFPISGVWTVRLDILIDDFKQESLEADVKIDR